MFHCNSTVCKTSAKIGTPGSRQQQHDSQQHAAGSQLTAETNASALIVGLPAIACIPDVVGIERASGTNGTPAKAVSCKAVKQ
jgi:hypothetical protein